MDTTKNAFRVEAFAGGQWSWENCTEDKTREPELCDTMEEAEATIRSLVDLGPDSGYTFDNLRIVDTEGRVYKLEA